jgi:hypothetical protein
VVTQVVLGQRSDIFSVGLDTMKLLSVVEILQQGGFVIDTGGSCDKLYENSSSYRRVMHYAFSCA